MRAAGTDHRPEKYFGIMPSRIRVKEFDEMGGLILQVPANEGKQSCAYSNNE
jgi:hypothetical protein